MFWSISNIRRRGIRSSSASTISSSIMTPHCGNKKRSSTDANKKNKAKKWGKTTLTVAAVSVCGASLLALMQMRFMWNYLFFEERTKNHVDSHGSQHSPSLRATSISVWVWATYVVQNMCLATTDNSWNIIAINNRTRPLDSSHKIT